MGAMLYVNIAKVQGVVSIDVLRIAIDLLQTRHALLQVHLQQSDGSFYFCPDGTLKIPLRVIERQNEQQWIEIAEDELKQKFSSEFAPLCRLTLLQSSEPLESHELIVTFHHAIADGISAVHCIHELLSYYQQIVEKTPVFPINSLPLLPPLEQLLETCLSEPETVNRTQVAPNSTSPSSTLIIEQTAPVGHRQTHLLPRTLNQDLTSQIKSQCHSQQTTVQGALCAAIILACIQQISANEPVIISCSSSVNLRASCVPLVESSHLGCLISNAITTHSAGLNTNFWELARECQSALHRQICDKVPQYRASNAELLNQYQSSFLAQLAEHNMGRNTTVHVSNLGQTIFKEDYGPIRLKSFHFAPGLSLVGTCFWLGAATVNQELFCTFTYVNPLISTQTAEILADAVICVLTRAIAAPSR